MLPFSWSSGSDLVEGYFRVVSVALSRNVQSDPIQDCDMLIDSDQSENIAAFLGWSIPPKAYTESFP